MQAARDMDLARRGQGAGGHGRVVRVVMLVLLEPKLYKDAR
jgi:hypothetical protein